MSSFGFNILNRLAKMLLPCKSNRLILSNLKVTFLTRHNNYVLTLTLQNLTDLTKMFEVNFNL